MKLNVKKLQKAGTIPLKQDYQFYKGQYDPELRRKMQLRAEANKPVNTTSEIIFDDKTMTAKRNPNAKMGLEIVSPEFQILTAGVGSLGNKAISIAGKIGQTMLHGAGQGAMANISNLSGSEQNLEGLTTDILGGAVVGGVLKGIGLGAKPTARYALQKAEPYLLGDKKIPMSGYKPKTSLINLERTTGKAKSNIELSTLFDNNFEINQRGSIGEIPSRIKIKGKSGQLEAVRNTLTGEYMFHNNMPSQLEAGKAMLTLDKYLPKNAVIKETESLSLDSYKNLLNFNRRKGWKLEPTNEYIDLNSSHKNSKLFEGIRKESNIGGFIDRNDAVEAVTRVNNMLKQKGFTQQADIKPLADGYYYNLVLPNFKATRLYKQGGKLIPKGQQGLMLNKFNTLSPLDPNKQFNNSKFNFLNLPKQKPLLNFMNMENIGYNSDVVLKLIDDFEGFKDKVYKDGKGIDTIGHGLTDKKYISKGTITKEESLSGVKSHIDREVLPHLKNKPYWNNLNDNQKSALISYVFNIGSGNFNTKSPSLQKALSEGNWNEAAKQIDFGYNDKKNPGLRKRRDKERQLFLQ